jgi:hypothetical protein
MGVKYPVIEVYLAYCFYDPENVGGKEKPASSPGKKNPKKRERLRRRNRMA